MSTMRLGGLASGMDTDALVINMMKAQRMKQDKLKANKTKLGWQQDKWKDLQTKLYKLYTDFASPMRLQNSYATKKATSSNSDKVGVTVPPGSNNIAEGSHDITVERLASSQYVTGGKIGLDKNGAKVTSSTKLTDLTGMQEGAIFTITSGGKESNFQVRADSTMGDYVYALKEAGLIANYDEGQGRLFINAKTSGADSAFSITSDQMSGGQITTKQDLDSYLQYGSLGSAQRAIIDSAYLTLRLDSTASVGEKQAARDSLYTIAKTNAETKQQADATKVVRDQYAGEYKIGGTYETEFKAIDKSVRDSAPDTWVEADIQAAIKNAIDAKAVEYTATDPGKAEIENQYTNVLNGGINAVLEGSGGVRDTLNAKVSAYENAAAGSGSAATSLKALGLAETDGTARPGSLPEDMVVVAAANSKIIYNGAVLENSSNTITLAGLIIEAKGITSEKVQLSVTKDTQAVYDKVKKFVNSYNGILKELNDLYYAKSAKGYEPLTEEEESAMTDKQIEDWENKIKDSLLRRDGNVNKLTTGMKNAMMSSVEVDGKKYSLANFGIATSDVDYMEKGLLHIFGDQEDSVYKSKPDKLMAALESDPELVAKVLSGVAGNLYKEMQKQMSGTTMRSALTFYNDKDMLNRSREYDSDIKEWDKKLNKMETKYYKQFSDMEVALSKLQSQQNSLAGMLGGN